MCLTGIILSQWWIVEQKSSLLVRQDHLDCSLNCLSVRLFNLWAFDAKQMIKMCAIYLYKQ